MNASVEKDPKMKVPTKSTCRYTIPDDYFEALSVRIMDSIDTVESIPPQQVDETVPVTIFVRIKPLLYLAASFLLLIGFFRAVDYISLTSFRTNDVAVETLKEKKNAHKSRSYVDQEYVRYIQSEYEDLIQADLSASGIWMD